MGNYDVICIGDAKLDAFLAIAETNTKCRFDENTKELCFKHGEKISIDHTYFSVGGNAANVTIGLSRLKIKATIAAEIGDDEFSLKIVNTFAKEYIDRGFIRQTPGKESSFSVAINYKDDRTLFTEHFKRSHDFKYEDAYTKWIYLTSLGEEWVNAYQKAIDYTNEHGTKLVFNPGTLQLSEKSSIIKDVLKVTNILFINKEEAKLLISEYADINSSDDIQEILLNIKKLGPKTVAITDGENGSHAIDEEGKYYHQDKIQCTIVERTGSGDAYSSGYLAAAIHQLGVQTAMKWGSINAASVIGKIGAQEGLLKKEEMEEKINELG